MHSDIVVAVNDLAAIPTCHRTYRLVGTTCQLWGERIIAAHAVEKKTGEWCAVAEEARADALSADPAYYSDRIAVLHFRGSVLAWVKYTIEDQAGGTRDTYSFDRDTTCRG